MTSDCPTEEQLAAFVEGALHASQADIRSHIEHCSTCLAWVVRVKARDDAYRDVRTAETMSLAAAEPPADPQALPQTIEGYTILSEIQRGGQGIVYQALQESTKRKVAVKVLLEGPYASASAKRRFEREIELVAQLKHPNIISIFHSGTTRDGRPFYVMDYVRGEPLHTYVRQHKLLLEDSLRIFAVSCESVQYAHQRGMIHRDLKPSNILVDADGCPRLLDFGMAKLLGMPSKSLVSASHQIMGTLPYMSPEQTRGNTDEIDTRTDVYSLGVILYELLTGEYPYPVTASLTEIVRHITESPPTPPIQRWHACAGIPSHVSKPRARRTCPIDGELQTIVLKALSKERERRYQSAGELARDIRHYLAGEPIEARRDSSWYVLRKALQRHRLSATVGLGYVILVTAAAIAAWFAYRKADDARLAHEWLADARAASHEAAQAALSLLDERQTIDPWSDRTPEPDKLERMANWIESASENQPRDVADLRNIIGLGYLKLGRYETARQHLDAALHIR